MERIKKRGRPEEKNMDPSYVSGVDNLYKDWLLFKNSTFPVPAPVLVMDASSSKEEFQKNVKKIIPQYFPENYVSP